MEYTWRVIEIDTIVYIIKYYCGYYTTSYETALFYLKNC